MQNETKKHLALLKDPQGSSRILKYPQGSSIEDPQLRLFNRGVLNKDPQLRIPNVGPLRILNGMRILN